MLAFVLASNIKFIPNRLYNYRIGRKGSLTSMHKGKSAMSNIMEVFRHVLLNWKKWGFLEGNEFRVLRYFINISYNVLVQLDHEVAVRYARDLLSLLWDYIDEERVVKALPSDVKVRLAYIQGLKGKTAA